MSKLYSGKTMYSFGQDDIKKLLALEPNSTIFSRLSRFRSSNPVKRFAFEKYLKYITEYISNSESVLDIGCGEGIILYLANKFNKREKLVGIDTSIEFLKIAKQIVEADFIRADVHYLPFRDSSFELLSCLSVFEHINRHKDVINEVTRVSTKSIITVPRPWLFRLICIISLRNWSRLGREKNHVKEFKKNELLDILPDKSTVERRSFWYVAKI